MQSVIVYRNPLEAAMWEMFMDGGGIVVFGGVIVLGILWVAVYMLTEKACKTTVSKFRPRMSWRDAQKYAMYAANGVTAIVAIAMLYNFFN